MYIWLNKYSHVYITIFQTPPCQEQDYFKEVFHAGIFLKMSSDIRGGDWARWNEISLLPVSSELTFHSLFCTFFRFYLQYGRSAKAFSNGIVNVWQWLSLLSPCPKTFRKPFADYYITKTAKKTTKPVYVNTKKNLWIWVQHKICWIHV